MKSELREKIIAYNKEIAQKKEMARDLSDMLERLYKVFELLMPIIPSEVVAIFKKYGYKKE